MGGFCDDLGMQDAQIIARIRRKFRQLRGALNERSRRLWAASEALEIGWGGVTAVAEATQMSQSTVRAGIAELKTPRRGKAALPPERIRRSGGGRRRAILNDPQLLPALDGLVEPTSRGDPESPLRWTIKSSRTLAEELTRQAHPVSYGTVATLLDQAGYSLQGNRKTREGSLASRPKRPVRVPERRGGEVPETRPAGHLGGHQKEGIGRGFQEWWPRLASSGATGRGPRA